MKTEMQKTKKYIHVFCILPALIVMYGCTQNDDAIVLKELQVGTKALEKEYHNQRPKITAKVSREGKYFFPYLKVFLAHDTILKLAFKHLDDSNFCNVYKMLIKKNNSFFDSVAKAGPKFWPQDYPLFTLKDDSLYLKKIPESYKREFIKQRVLRHWISCSDVISYATGKMAIRCFQSRFRQFGFQLNVQQKDTVTQLKLVHTTFDDDFNEHTSYIEFKNLYRIERTAEHEPSKQIDLKNQVLFTSEHMGNLTIKTKPLSPGKYALLINVQTISEYWGLKDEEAVYSFDIN
jgi:hypothetical protein